MERDEEMPMVSIKWISTNQGTEEHTNANARPVTREFNTGDKQGLMAMRTVISRTMTRGVNIDHAGRCQDSLLVWRRKEIVARRVATLK